MKKHHLHIVHMFFHFALIPYLTYINKEGINVVDWWGGFNYDVFKTCVKMGAHYDLCLWMDEFERQGVS